MGSLPIFIEHYRTSSVLPSFTQMQIFPINCPVLSARNTEVTRQINCGPYRTFSDLAQAVLETGLHSEILGAGVWEEVNSERWDLKVVKLRLKRSVAQ